MSTLRLLQHPFTAADRKAGYNIHQRSGAA
jgi:hypothetical protein